MANAEVIRTYARPRRHLEEAVHVSLERLGYDERQDDNGDIVAVARPSLDSWGEDIVMEIAERGSTTSVRYSSQAGWQLFDWGKSRRNVEALAADVERRLDA